MQEKRLTGAFEDLGGVPGAPWSPLEPSGARNWKFRFLGHFQSDVL